MFKSEKSNLKKKITKSTIVGQYNPTFWKEAGIKHFRYKYFTVAQLMFFDVHLGGNERDIIETSYWFIYGRRKGFIFIDLHPTILMLRRLVLVLSSIIKNRGKFMFVDSDRTYCWGTKLLAEEIGEAYVIYSWVGGLLTNFKKIWAFYNGELRPTDWSLLGRPRARLKFILQGLDGLIGPPSLIFINRLGFGQNAAAESHAIAVPSIGLVDLNTYSDEASYLIPSNDDSIRTVTYFNRLIAQAVMKSKYYRVLGFIRRKNYRERRRNAFWDVRSSEMTKMLNYFTRSEIRHTAHFRLPLREWAALRQARRVFAGYTIPYSPAKSTISFIFKRLRRDRFMHKPQLKTLRKLKQKASFIYKRYYNQFFNVKPRLEIFRKKRDRNKPRKKLFLKSIQKHDKRFPVKVLSILQKVRWLYELKNKYQHLNLWLKWKTYSQWKNLSISNLSTNGGKKKLLTRTDKFRLKNIYKFYKYFNKEYNKIKKLYLFYFKHHFMPLQALFLKIKNNMQKSEKNMYAHGRDLGELFNSWYFGENFYKTDVKDDAHAIWNLTLERHDMVELLKEVKKAPADFREKFEKNLIATSKPNDPVVTYALKTFKREENIKSRSRPRFNQRNFKKGIRQPQRNNFHRNWRHRPRNPYSWRFRRQWRPRKVSHFFKYNPYYLALLRNRPWFPKKEIIRFKLNKPQNANQYVLKHKLLYNLMAGDFKFFLKDSGFETKRDFFSFSKKINSNLNFIFNPAKLVKSHSIDKFKPVKFDYLIPFKLRWYFAYWSFKLDIEQLSNHLNLFYLNKDQLKILPENEQIFSNFRRSLKEEAKAIIERREALELKKKKERLAGKARKDDGERKRVYNIFEEIIRRRDLPSFYRTLPKSSLYFKPIKLKSGFKRRQEKFIYTDLLMGFYYSMLSDNRKIFSSHEGKFSNKKSFKSSQTRAKLKMLDNLPSKIKWASCYYDLSDYYRYSIRTYSSLFETEVISNNNKLKRNHVISNQWRLVTHLQRYQTTSSFLKLFLLGRLQFEAQTARIKSPHLRRLKRKIEKRRNINKTYNSRPFRYKNIKHNNKQFSDNSQINISNKSGKGYLTSGKRLNKKFNNKRKLSPYHLAKRKRRFDSLKKLFPFHFWLKWYGGLNLLNLFQRSVVHSYLAKFKRLLSVFKRSKDLSHKVVKIKRLFSLFQTILRILAYKTGDTVVLKVLFKLRNQLKGFWGDGPRFSESTTVYFQKLLETIRKVSENKKPSRHSKYVSLSYFWRLFYKNTAKIYSKPLPVFASKNITLIDIFHRKSFFFNRHGFSFLKQDVFNKAGNSYSKDNKFPYQNANYDYLEGMPLRVSQYIFMRLRSKFNYNKYLKFYSLKLSKRFRGRVYLETLFNNFKYGRIKTAKQYRTIREVVHRLHHINKQRHSIFVEMFQNNPYVDRPHLKANLDKYPGTHLFFLKNYGPKRFYGKRKFDALDDFYFIRWSLRRKHGTSAGWKRRARFLFRMWRNKSMFLSS